MGKVYSGVRRNGDCIQRFEADCRKLAVVRAQGRVYDKGCIVADGQFGDAQLGQVHGVVYVERYGAVVLVDGSLGTAVAVGIALPFHFESGDAAIHNRIGNVIFYLA